MADRDFLDIDALLEAHWPLWERLCDADDGDSHMALDVLRPAGYPSSDTRPWLVWVHPGDACEDDCGDGDVRDMARALQAGMGDEIRTRMETHRLAVVHRQSTAFAFEPLTDRVDGSYAEAMARIADDRQAAHVWTDDLTAVGAWLAPEGALPQRVFLTGAWSDPRNGCVTAVGKGLQARGWEVEVSAFSPSEPGTTEGAWRPGAGRRPRP